MSRKNPKPTMKDFKTRLVAHPVSQAVTAALLVGAGNPVGDKVPNYLGPIAQPIVDTINAHPNGAPLFAAGMGTLTGFATAAVAQRRDVKAAQQQQNVVTRTASLNPHITKNYKNPR